MIESVFSSLNGAFGLLECSGDSELGLSEREGILSLELSQLIGGLVSAHDTAFL